MQLLLFRTYGRLPTPVRRFLVRRAAPSFSVGAVCVVERDDGALLLVRPSYRDSWGFPGGLLNRGEEAADAARREALEELGLEVELLGEPSVVVDAGARRVDVIFRARLSSDSGHEVQPASAELEAVQWFPPQALPDLLPEAVSTLAELARLRRPRPVDPG